MFIQAYNRVAFRDKANVDNLRQRITHEVLAD